MKHILTSLALLTLTTTLSHGMIGEIKEAVKRLTPVIKRSISSFPEREIIGPNKVALRAFSSVPKIDIHDCKQRISTLLQEKIKLDNNMIKAAAAFDTTSANKIDRKIVDSYINQLRSQNLLSCQVINELSMLYPEEPLDTSKFNHPPIV